MVGVLGVRATVGGVGDRAPGGLVGQVVARLSSACSGVANSSTSRPGSKNSPTGLNAATCADIPKKHVRSCDKYRITQESARTGLAH